jgi:DNA repair exonuclease SbcCD nuclease subunit
MPFVAVIADSHFCEESRFDECVGLHDWIVRDLAKRNVDLIIHTGDVFERKSTPTERIAVANFLRGAAEIAPVIIVRGNHDALGDLAIYRSLRTRHAITVEETCGVHVVRGIAVAAVAWPRKAHLLASVQGGHQETEQAAGDAMRSVLRGLGAELAAHDGPRILAMHAMVRGSVTSVGQPLVGCDLEIGLEDLALTGAQFAALGHIHKGQSWEHGDMAIVYPGSPRRTAFGEVEEKGYVLVEVNGEGDALWESIVVPATPMILALDEWSGTGWVLGWPAVDPDKGASVEAAEVRLRYEVASDHRDAAKRAVGEFRDELLRRGAVSVKVDEQVIATMRARAPEISTAKTIDEKLRALWVSRRDVPEANRAERLLTKTHDLEGEVAA